MNQPSYKPATDEDFERALLNVAKEEWFTKAKTGVIDITTAPQIMIVNLETGQHEFFSSPWEYLVKERYDAFRLRAEYRSFKRGRFTPPAMIRYFGKDKFPANWYNAQSDKSCLNKMTYHFEDWYIYFDD